MRGLIIASLVMAGLATAHPSPSGDRRRKSLAFGHEPRIIKGSGTARGNTPSLVQRSTVDPMDVARAHLAQTLLPGKTENRDYYIRKDSYTDTLSGVTHVYVRQLVNGFEVSDGDMQLNIVDGGVLSYSSSFFDGEVKDSGMSSAEPHQAYCSALSSQLDTALMGSSDGQAVLGGLSNEAPADTSLLEHLVDSNCAHVGTPHRLHDTTADVEVPFAALMQLMIAVTPNLDLAENMLENYGQYASKMELYANHDLAGTHGSTAFVVTNVPDAVAPVKARIAFVQVPNKAGETELQLVWKFEVEMKDNWYEAAVSAHGPHRIVAVTDWASDSPMPTPEARLGSSPPAATYNVFPWGVNDPSEGDRSIQKENFDALASPVGWHTLPFKNEPEEDLKKKKTTEFWKNTTTTFGNNVFSHEDWEGRNNWLDNYRPDAGESLVFDYKYDPKKTNNSQDAMTEAKAYINATVTQLFYTSNMFHDLMYRYGFDEVSGNFQQHNFGRGGKENDAVITNAQDGSGFNNANFMTPPDGQNGRCRMYLWNTATPYRDGDLEAGIVIHELAHGLSTRLTGGPANSGCLGYGESGGMGEGWGDFLATMIRSTANYSDYPMGAWAANTPKGIRNFVYSTNNLTNPSTYETLDKPGYWGVHAIGEVWAQGLFVVAQKMIAKHGFSDTLFPPKPLADGTVPVGDFYRKSDSKKPLVPKHGNSLIVQLVVSGMKLQPCRPSFFDARDAIIQADQVLTGGENLCLLWEGFAEVGLGPNAAVIGKTPWGGGVRTNDRKLPAVCQ